MSANLQHRIEINRKATRVGTFEVRFPTHVALPMFIRQVLASQLPFLANRNSEHTVPPLLWPVNCIKIGEHVALLSGPTVYSLYCACSLADTTMQLAVMMWSAGSLICNLTYLKLTVTGSGV